MTASSDRPASIVGVGAVAAGIGLVWAAGAALPIGRYLGGPATFVDIVSTWWFSLMLASLAGAAWLAVKLAPGVGRVAAAGRIVAGAGVAGAIGNVLEDVVQVEGAEYLYGIGLLGTFIGLLALALVLLRARRWTVGALVVGTLAGIVVEAGHGPPVMAILWLGLAAWVAVRGLP